MDPVSAGLAGGNCSARPDPPVRVAAGGVPPLIALAWPRSERVVEFAAVMITRWTYLVSFRTLSVRFSDDTFLLRGFSLLLYPAGLFWATIVLQGARLYGVMTCWKQRWTTRRAGTESLLLPKAELAAGRLGLEGALP